MVSPQTKQDWAESFWFRFACFFVGILLLGLFIALMARVPYLVFGLVLVGLMSAFFAVMSTPRRRRR